MRKGEEALKGKETSWNSSSPPCIAFPAPQTEQANLLLSPSSRGNSQRASTHPWAEQPTVNMDTYFLTQLFPSKLHLLPACVVLSKWVAVHWYLPFAGKKWYFQVHFSGCPCSSSRSCGRGHRAALWLALAGLTLLKAAVRKGQLLNVN